ncbi:ABC transporter substrate-binding protein [Tannockella kyphosi]|uniref:ABC transporter substrate-binding protein n=1 Tax=Tannockella kyphosi TaxID=2899121 RepID=UPI002011EAB9|nr:ABC transporter substrate-binding protein [Tannockella kyphosi]
MKKLLVLVLSVCLSCTTLVGCSSSEEEEDRELVIYGSCEEEYLAAVAVAFEEYSGISVSYQRLSTGEVLTKIEEEDGNPSADVWFGGTTDPYNEAAELGLLYAYDAENAENLIGDQYKHEDNYWYGIYTGILGIFWNTEELDRLGLEAPSDWDDLLNPEYEGLIAFANPNTSGTGLLFINTMVQIMGEDAAMDYFAELDNNIMQYTKSGSGASKMVPLGEVVIGVGFLHDVVYQIVDMGYDNIGMTAPTSGTSYEIGATAIFEGATNMDEAQEFIEFALSPDCVDIAQENGSYQFLVIDGAADVQAAVDAGLDTIETIEYDFEDATANGSAYRETFFEVINNDDRVMTE